MDYLKIPIGFSMALAANETALTAYAAMPEQERQTILVRACNARSREEMQQIVADIAPR